MTKDLTREASMGFYHPHNPCPYLYSSASHIAWAAGRWLKITNRSAPRNVSMSKGYNIHANDMLLKWIKDSQFERIN